MTAMTNRWFMYGEPTDDGRVRAQIVQTYNDGSDDDVTLGYVGDEVLELVENDSEIRDAVQIDAPSVIDLTFLSKPKEHELLETWEEHNDSE